MAKKNKSSIEENIVENIVQQDIDEILSTGFGRYSKYVLQERAVPDVRDGLKPVQRRIIYTMYLEGNVASKPTRKCARTVGAVIGRFHPHGDASVYDAMVRLSQGWKMRIPLIVFQGNNGNIDGDGPAHYRYTEARLAEISEEMIRDLNKDTVDMELNFDDVELEPIVLPSRFPNLLVNGSQGVAVGASTDIPPHNLGEVIDAIIYRIHHKRCQVDDLLSFIQGPDFPTGGQILNRSDIPNIYKTGKGIIRLMCHVFLEDDKNNHNIVIDQIPYGIEKRSLVRELAKLRVSANLDAINDIRDETDKKGLRIVIEVNESTDLNELKKFIISKGVLTASIKVNLLVIDHNRPHTVNLLEAIDCYIEHQKDVILRRTKFDLDKYEDRLHVVEGLIKATSIIDEVIKTIRSSKDKSESRENLISRFGFTERQAEALLNLQLYRLSNTDVTTLIQESNDLKNKISECKNILSSEDKVNSIISADLKQIKAKFNTPRMTTFLDEELDLKVDLKALVTKEEVFVAFTRDGYLKKTSLKSYNPEVLPGLKDLDVLRGGGKVYSTDNLMLITSLGNYLSIPVFKIPETKWKEQGKHINEIGALGNNEKIVFGFAYSDLKEGVFLTMLSKNGKIKKTSITEFATNRIARTAKAFSLDKEDELIQAGLTYGDNNLLVVSSDGYSCLYSENELSPMSTKAGGVKALSRLQENAYLISLIILEESKKTPLYVLAKEQSMIKVTSDKLTLSSRTGSKDQLFSTFKSKPVTCLGVIDGTNKDHLDVVLQNKVRDKIDLNKIDSKPLKTMLRSNTLSLISNDPILDYSLDGIVRIDEDTKVKKVTEVLNKKDSKKDEDNHVEYSYYDYFGDDD